MYRPDGARLKALREEQKLSISALARAAKVTKRTIIAWESYKGRPDFQFNTLARIASVLVVPYAELIEYVPDPQEENG